MNSMDACSKCGGFGLYVEPLTDTIVCPDCGTPRKAADVQADPEALRRMAEARTALQKAELEKELEKARKINRAAEAENEKLGGPKMVEYVVFQWGSDPTAIVKTLEEAASYYPGIQVHAIENGKDRPLSEIENSQLQGLILQIISQRDL